MFAPFLGVPRRTSRSEPFIFCTYIFSILNNYTSKHTLEYDTEKHTSTYASHRKTLVQCFSELRRKCSILFFTKKAAAVILGQNYRFDTLIKDALRILIFWSNHITNATETGQWDLNLRGRISLDILQNVFQYFHALTY